MATFLVPVDLSSNELRNALLQSLGVEPSAVTGRFYLDTSASPPVLRYYNGTGWISLGAGGVVGVLDDLTDVIITAPAIGHTLLHDGATFVNTDFDTRVRLSRLDQMAAPTASVDANTQKITNLADATLATDAASLGVVNTQIAALVDAAPATLDTLNELAAALGDDPAFAATLASQIGALDTRVDTLETETLTKYAIDVGNGTNVDYTITHNLNTMDVTVLVRQFGPPYAVVWPDIDIATVNTITLHFTTAPAASAYRCVVTG